MSGSGASRLFALPTGSIALSAVVFIIALISALWSPVATGRLGAPPEVGDGQDYEAIAFNLWMGRGYAYSWSDEEWKSPYQQDPKKYAAVLARSGPVTPTAYRPPLVPLLISGTFAIFGRVFYPWRIISAVFAAAACGLAVWLAGRLGNNLTPYLACGAMYFADTIVLDSPQFLTEGVSTLLVTCLAVCLYHLHNSTKPFRLTVPLGIIFGLLLLARSVAILWLPIIWGVIWLTLPSSISRFEKAKFLILKFAVSAAIFLPWAIRNSVVFARPAPFGTQGSIESAAAFSPRALEGNGMWRKEAAASLGITPADERGLDEAQLGALHTRATIGWLIDNPFSSLQLIIKRLWSVLWDRLLLENRILVLISLLALLIRRRGGVPSLALLLLCVPFSTALTWNAPQGRFWLPFYPLMYVLSALVLSVLIEAINPRKSPS